MRRPRRLENASLAWRDFHCGTLRRAAKTWTEQGQRHDALVLFNPAPVT